MLVALFLAKPMEPSTKAQLASIKHQFGIIILKILTGCFLSCWAYRVKEKGSSEDLRSCLMKCFLISLGFFAAMYILYMVEFILVMTMNSDPNVGPIDWIGIFAVKLLFWEILVIYNLMLIYGLFNFGFLKERALTKLDDSGKFSKNSKEGGEAEDIPDVELVKQPPQFK